MIGGIVRTLVWCALAIVLAAPSAAQTVTGEIRGTVRDSSGGVLPGATVTAIGVETGLKRTEVTGSTGTYVFPNLPIGKYTVTAELEGFSRAEKTGFDLVADGRITADLTMAVGALTETVTVEGAAGDVVNKTSGELARVVDGETVRSLALSGRNYLELTTLVPGAITTDDDQMAVTTGLGTGGTFINGNRGNSNNLTVDGGFNLDSGSNSSMINNVSLAFIDQVAIQTSNFAADKGRNSGASVNVVTKSGTNRFSGSVYETFRDESLHAANYFAPKDANGNAIKAKEDFNLYGGTLGGPIVKGKLFFFTGVEWKSLDRQESPQRRTLPTRAELRGDFSARIAGPDGVAGTADDNNIANQLVDPVTKQPFPGNVIPTDRFTTDGRAIAAVYERMISLATVYSDTPTANNATYQLDFPFDWRQDIVRVDYRHNESQSYYIRYLHDTYDLIEPRGTFINANLPTIPTNRVRPGYGIQLAHTWIVSQNLFNDFKATASWNGQRIPPVGDVWKRDTYAFQFPQVYSKGQYDEGIPNVTFSGTGNPGQLTGPSQSLLSPTTDITFTNNLTWIKNTHTVRTGVIVTRNRKDQNGRFQHTGVVNFNASGNPNTTGYAFADALLGNFRTYSEGGDDPLGFFRFTQYSGYVTDTWRAKENLSLEIGLRYEYSMPIYTQGNNISNFDPALYDPAHAMVLNPNGSVASVGVNRYTGMISAGDGVPEDQRDRVTIDPEAQALIPTGAPRGLYETYHLIMPRFSGAYSFNDKWVIRGGIGLFYDKPEGNVVFSQLNLPPFVPSVSVENANLANPLAGQASAATVLGGINAIDPNLKTPRQLQYSVGVQRELPYGHFLEVTYVGNRGRDLLWQPEINNPTFEEELANQLLPSAQRANTNFLRPYKGFSSIRQRRSDAFSDHNSLQLYLNKRRGDIMYAVSYTLGKTTGFGSGNGDDLGMDDEGWRPADNFDVSYFVGPTSFDRRHALVITPTYTPPFMRGRRDIAGQILGGWEISGKIRWQSGQYLTPVGNTLIGDRRADYNGQEIGIDDRSEARWFNTDAFTSAPDDRRGNATVGMIEGPHWKQVDVSLRKKLRFTRNQTLEFRAEVFNVFNTLNLNNPNTNVTNSAYGTITSARIPRQSQFLLQFAF
jgi:hypothetical protein